MVFLEYLVFFAFANEFAQLWQAGFAPSAGSLHLNLARTLGVQGQSKPNMILAGCTYLVTYISSYVKNIFTSEQWFLLKGRLHAGYAVSGTLREATRGHFYCRGRLRGAYVQ